MMIVKQEFSLQEETMQALQEADVNENMAKFIHEMLVSSIHLYGYMAVEEFWSLFRSYRTEIRQLKLPVIHKRHVLAYVNIAGKEDGILVVKGSELTENPDDNTLFLASPVMVREGENKYHRLMDKFVTKPDDMPWFFPKTLDEFLSYTKDPLHTKEYDRLLCYMKEIVKDDRTAEELASFLGTNILSGVALVLNMSQFLLKLNRIGAVVNYAKLQKLVMRCFYSLRIWPNLGWTWKELESDKPLRETRPLLMLSDKQLREFEANGISYDEIVKMGLERGVDTEVTYHDLPRR